MNNGLTEQRALEFLPKLEVRGGGSLLSFSKILTESCSLPQSKSANNAW